jgi:hypothetical protein
MHFGCLTEMQNRMARIVFECNSAGNGARVLSHVVSGDTNTGIDILGHDRHYINPLNTELNPICHLLALLGAHHILHVSRVRVN